MSAWTNAEIHVYLDRNRQWRARVSVTVDGQRLQFDVPPRDRPSNDHAHGLVPLFLQLVEELEHVRQRKKVTDGDG